MTDLERRVLTAIVNSNREPHVCGAEYDGGERTENCDPIEAARLLQSADFKRGWEECRRSFHASLSELVRGTLTTADMKRYVASA